MEIQDFSAEKWIDLPGNPLISPPREWTPVLGDPQVVLPGEVDDLWHMYLTGRGKLFRYSSPDGIRWDLENVLDWGVATTFLLRVEGGFYLYYAAIRRVEGMLTVIGCRFSRDLENWDEELIILKPETDWEREGKWKEVRNPCFVRLADGTYRLYYSGGTIFLEDCGYEEPLYIGVAESNSPTGPFKRVGDKPILLPDPAKPYRNFGAGSMKVYPWNDGYLGFDVGKYKDDEGRNHACISLLVSDDGLSWQDVPYNPILPPTTGWKAEFVYQLDVVKLSDRLRIYYNARGGWADSAEGVGASEIMLAPGEGRGFPEHKVYPGSPGGNG